MRTTLPCTRDIVLIGGGHAHAVALRMWAMDPLPGARLTLINPQPTSPYTGMLPGFIAGHYAFHELEIDLIRLARFAGARIILDEVVGLERDGKQVLFAGRPPVEYDIASINIGISTGLPGALGNGGIPAKPMARYAALWEGFLETVKSGAPARAAVVGGGVAGTELAMAMAYRLRQIADSAVRVALLEKGPTLMPENPVARRRILPELDALGIDVKCNADVREVTASGALLAGGDIIEAGFTALAAGARPAGWLAATGLALHDGFIRVSETLQTIDDPSVFAVGDTAWMDASPREKAGVFAVRQGPVLAHNLRAAASSGKFQTYRPQRDYLKLISLGGKSAVATKFGRSFKGRALWHLKDRIDRRFMKRLTRLQPMRVEPIPRQVADGVSDIIKAGPLCGGCGSKLGKAELGRVLANLPAPQRKDVLFAPGDDAAILAHGDRDRQVVTTDHLRAFVDDPGVMARIAAIHAMGDIWAMGADPQAALASIILPPLSPDLQRRTLSEIMAAASAVFRAAGADIVGGHSSQGTELTIGFSVTGLTAGPVITLAGAQPGDLLVLSKPIGVGTIMAADMRLQASGRDVAAALDQMSAPSSAAVRILRDAATAMTDVTGFGLAGHLDAICEASGVSAEVALDRVPFVSGARELATIGVRSSLFAQNAATALNAGDFEGDPRVALMFDPQTAGGLLAAIPADRADDLVNKLRVDAPQTTLIGRIAEQGPDRLRLVPG